jgi:hypothetical protein
MTQKKVAYKYKGPIYRFEHIAISKWEAVTMAVSPQQALNNLTFRAKATLKYSKDSRLTLDRKYLTEV